MRKNHTFKIKSTCALFSAIVIAGLSVQSISSAQNNADGSIATSAVVPQYAQSELTAAGCDIGVWNKMVEDYKTKAVEIAILDTEQLVKNVVKATPPASALSKCFDQAANIINTATRVYGAIARILTGGGLDSSDLLNYVKNVAVGYGCGLVNSYIASTGISNQINSVGNIPQQVMGQPIKIGDVYFGSGSQMLQQGSWQQGNVQTGTVTGSDLAGALGAR